MPARNEELHLESCLASLHAQAEELKNLVAVSLVVVDNSSTDATVKIARRCKATVVNVLPGNPGRARNAGAAEFNADVVAFVDADCVLPRGWLRQMLKHLAESTVVAVGAIQGPASPDAPWVERVWVEMIAPSVKASSDRVLWLPAFNLAVRKSVFDDLGGFDESLATCEDSDLSYRLAIRGELRRDNDFSVRHLGESKTIVEFFQREMWRSQGNFRSAWKRGTTVGECVSLFLPLSYTLVVALAVFLLMISIVVGGFRSWVIFATIGIGVTILPLAIALVKRRRFGKILPAAVLVATYLLARGLGPLVPSRRVPRSGLTSS
ncbi:glycosyltransferase [Novipirellula artificiosorum]|uniref:glycosyltransferase n=1 Tax=Novipirellula artificiosorum TaxID=2528016 RepID=UPI0018CF99FA